MHLTIRILGAEVLCISTERDQPDGPGGDPGDCTTYPVGFVASPGDQRWESGVELR